MSIRCSDQIVLGVLPVIVDLEFVVTSLSDPINWNEDCTLVLDSATSLDITIT